MWRFRSMAFRLRGLLMVRGRDRELSGEIEEHLWLLAERFVQQGMGRETRSTPPAGSSAVSRSFRKTIAKREGCLPWRTSYAISLSVFGCCGKGRGSR